jgi:amidase
MSGDIASRLSIEEATIDDIHLAFREGRATAVGVTQVHLDRIAAYDRKGPALGAVIITNPHALADAAALDAYFRKNRALVGPLHGIPVLVKDNYDVAGLQTTAGSAALIGWVPARDASVVRALRAAGAVILAKTSMSEWARGGLDNINSVLPGFARNPYNTARATGGSSGGTGAGLAASFGVVGLGSDTFGSIRNPSSNNALVGLRPSWALVSRAGMVGLYDARDTAGPMARTINDLAALLDVIAGVDADDPATAGAAGKIPPTYKAFLDKGGARGKRLGVLRQAFAPEASDPNVVGLLDRAVADLRNCGAEIIDPFIVPEFGEFPAAPHPASEVRAAIERYLEGTGPGFPKALSTLVASEKFHPLHEAGLKVAAVAPPPHEDPAVARLEASEIRMRAAYLGAMERDRIDAFVLPVAVFPPKLNGDRTPAGATTWIASGLHWPALAVPMGYTYEDLPSGLQIVGRPWSEPLLIAIGYAYEHATRHRRPPAATPKLEGGRTDNRYRINDPAIVAEVEREFAGYDKALGANDIDALNRYFFDSPMTVRFGNGENLYGFDEIKAYRASIASGSAPRRERTVITTFGRDFATVATLTRMPRPGKTGRTMQTWVRFPQGWRIVAAHVSIIDHADQD